MDRARRAEPYSNATIWTREVARNLAGHLARMSKVQSCVDTRSPKSTKLPKFQHAHPHKRCTMKTRPPIVHDERAEEEMKTISDQALHNDRNDQCPVSARVKLEQEHARALLGTRKVKKTHKLPVQPSSKEDDHPVRAPLSVASSFDDCAYEQPACVPHLAARPQDFAKKQEQLKIWQENQAMMKRLRSTKPTLNCKEWEKDDKWNQQFLKTQQERRFSLQHELSKTLGSAAHVPPLREMTATASKRPPNEKALPGTANGLHGPSTAPAHRRIMQLRKQKSVSSETNESQKEWPSQQPELDAPPSLDFHNAEDPLADNQLLNVRFTFSRQRQRKGSKKSMYDAEKMGLSGAFSPAIEIEATLDAIAFRKPGEGEHTSSNNNQITDEPDQTNGDNASVEVDQTAEINAVVFEVMQDSIDRVAETVCLQLMQEEASESDTKEQETIHAQYSSSEMDENQVEIDETGDSNRTDELLETIPATINPANAAWEIASSLEPNATVESLLPAVEIQPAETEGITTDAQEAAATPVSSRNEQPEEYDGDDFDDEPAILNASITALESDHIGTELPEAKEEVDPAFEYAIHEQTEYDEENYDDEEDEDDGVSYSVDDFQ